MADKPIFWSRDDVRLIQRMLDRERRQTINAQPMQITDRWDQGEDHQAPEVYIARPLTSLGVPGLSVGDGYADYDYPVDSYGDYFDRDQVPGSALCGIYKLVRSVGSRSFENELVATGRVERVYNVSTSSLTQDYFPIARDKFGKWLSLSAGGGGSNESIDFVILEWFPAADPDVPVCDCVLAEVTAVSCGASVAVGDEVLVCDPQLCWFNLPVEILVGSVGHANLMDRGGIFSNLECPTLLTDYSVGACIWVVRGICCTESAGYV